MKIHFLIVTLINFALSTPDYYWRDYDGEIPLDAVPGGTDRRGRPTYIGQVLLHKGNLHEGLFPTRVYPGTLSMTTSRDGIHTTSQFNKILCSPLKEQFAWLPATAQNLHVVAIGKYLIPGGMESGALLYIGRVAYQGEVIVGKIAGYQLGNAKLYFPYNDQESEIDTFEVLVFNGIVDELDIINLDDDRIL